MSHPDLADEQAHLDFAARCLIEMQERSTKARAIADRSVIDENTADARVAQFHLQRREAALRATSGLMCFGRIDTEHAERFYVGRRHIEDDESQPVIVDWRAPVSAAFYRATFLDPCGLTFRRRFSMDDDQVVALFDEDLTDPESGGQVGLPDPLIAELDRSRSGQMRDIVATIAAEQDEIIRAPISELVVVQGGPGTGKTAVGLHRAAFLLFQHRLELMDQRVLVLGPNPLFLRYIADVLPSLGETAVRQATLVDLFASKYPIGAVDEPAVRRLKGDARMAEVVESAIRSRISAPADGLEVRAGLAVVRFPKSDLDEIIEVVLSRRLPINQGRDVFRQMLIAEAWRRHSQRAGTDLGGEPTFKSSIRSDSSFTRAVGKMWPTITAKSVVDGLLRSPTKLRRAAEGVLTTEEQALLQIRLSDSPASKNQGELWSESDLPLLDEAEVRCSGLPARYGHVVVDEAQDLSHMELRVVGRRAQNGSMTILGDIAQATDVSACGDWQKTVDGLRSAGQDPESVSVHHTELTVGYRVPASILDVANRLLAEAAPTVTPVRSVRPGGDPPLLLSVDRGQLLLSLVTEVVELRSRMNSVAVVALADRLEEVALGLAEAGIAAERVGASGLPGVDAVALVSPEAVKGLEFDAVVIVEPSDVVALPSGLRHLYVAMTRAVQHLGVIHAKSLPPQML